MNYYSHHIGDFDRATRHLTRIERSIYRDLLDVYYDSEQQLTLDMAALCRRVIARTNEEATAVQQVLNEFFIETPTGWYHDRCEEELDAYRTSTSQKSAAGKASAAKRATKRQQALNGNSTSVEQPYNGCGTAQQLTNNQEPITKNQKPIKTKDPAAPIFDAMAELMALGVATQTATDFLQNRKKNKLTQTALKGIIAEADKAGYSLDRALEVSCKRGWQSFEAAWVLKDARGSPGGYQTANDKAKSLADRLTGKARNEQHNQFDFIDLNPVPP